MALDLQEVVLRQASEDEINGSVKLRVLHEVDVTNRDGRKMVHIATLASFLPSLPMMII